MTRQARLGEAWRGLVRLVRHGRLGRGGARQVWKGVAGGVGRHGGRGSLRSTHFCTDSTSHPERLRRPEACPDGLGWNSEVPAQGSAVAARPLIVDQRSMITRRTGWEQTSRLVGHVLSAPCSFVGGSGRSWRGSVFAAASRSCHQRWCGVIRPLGGSGSAAHPAACDTASQ